MIEDKPTFEDKPTLAAKRAALIQRLARASVEDQLVLQAELRIVNAQIKALNTAEAARLKAEADRRKLAGMVEARNNAARARAKLSGGSVPESDVAIDDDPGQTTAIDGWIDAVLLRHDIEFTRSERGLAIVDADIPQKVINAIELLISGINAAARGQELPDLPREARAVSKPQKPSKSGKKRS